MHLIVPFAGRATPPRLPWLRLRSLLARCEVVLRDEGDETCLTPPHERALARALGWQGGDGQLPWAARAAAADGLSPGEQAWGLLSPTHWHLGTDQVSLIDPAALLLDDTASREVFEAVKALFTSEGFAMHYGAATRWYIAHDSLATLRCASLDRVIGRNVDRWMVPDPAARLIRRLQNEVQMLLYTHAVNDRRQAQGLLSVNSFWLSGCGRAQPERGQPFQVDDRLRGPALSDDMSAWSTAWQTLEDGPLAELPQAGFQLTLCGERHAVTLAPAAGWSKRLRSWWSQPAPAVFLESL